MGMFYSRNVELHTHLSTAKCAVVIFTRDIPWIQDFKNTVPYTVSAVCNLLSPSQVIQPVVDSSTIHYYSQQLVTYT